MGSNAEKTKPFVHESKGGPGLGGDESKEGLKDSNQDSFPFLSGCSVNYLLDNPCIFQIQFGRDGPKMKNSVIEIVNLEDENEEIAFRQPPFVWDGPERIILSRNSLEVNTEHVQSIRRQESRRNLRLTF